MLFEVASLKRLLNASSLRVRHKEGGENDFGTLNINLSHISDLVKLLLRSVIRSFDVGNQY